MKIKKYKNSDLRILENFRQKVYNYIELLNTYKQPNKLISTRQIGGIIKHEPVSTYVHQYNPRLIRSKHLVKDTPLSEDILKRASELNEPYSNYEDALDWKDTIVNKLRVLTNKGISNCTLTATLIVNPDKPIASAIHIVENPNKWGYAQIPESQAPLGTLVIASLPGKPDVAGENAYHTMVLTGYAKEDGTYNFEGKDYPFNKGDILVSYSNGKDKYRKNIPLSVYTANSDGKSTNRFYKSLLYDYPEVLLPSAEVTFK